MRKEFKIKYVFAMILLCMICAVGKPQNASANTGNIYAFVCTGSGADDTTVKNDAKEIREVLLKNTSLQLYK